LAGLRASLQLAEVGHEVQPASEGLDVAGDDFEGGDLVVLDLGYAGDADAHGGGDLLLAQAQLLAGLGELVPARLAGLCQVAASHCRNGQAARQATSGTVRRHFESAS